MNTSKFIFSDDDEIKSFDYFLKLKIKKIKRVKKDISLAPLSIPHITGIQKLLNKLKLSKK